MTQGLLIILAVSFALGIALADWSHPPIFALAVASLVLVALGLLVARPAQATARWRSGATSTLLALAMVCAGGAWHAMTSPVGRAGS